MSTHSLISSVTHERRIRDLQHLAEAQRNRFDAQLEEVAASLKPLEITRNVLAYLTPTLPFVLRLFGPGRLGLGLSSLLAAFNGLGRTSAFSQEKGRFPIKAALLVGTSAMQVIRWLKGRRRSR